MKQTVFLLALALCGACAGAQTIPLTISGHTVLAETARTQEQLERGLMFRKELPEGQGMLFYFPSPNGYCMWMKNTLIPLSVAFAAQDGRIINIEDMQPQTTALHCAKAPASYALEVPLGWFRKNKIAAGAGIEGISQ